MIAVLLVALLVIVGLVYVASPLRSGPAYDTVDISRLVEEAEGRKESALLAIIDIEEERAVGKLSDTDFDALRDQYEIEALHALRQLDELGAGGRSDDAALEAEIARVRAELNNPGRES